MMSFPMSAAACESQCPSVVVVAPVYNEVDGVEHFVRSVLAQLAQLNGYRCTMLLVDDGSTDGTACVLDCLHDEVPDRIGVIHLSRNFGHQAALTAGIDHADADAVICLDADMQHPPALIPQMLARWRDGFDIVQCVRRRTAGVSLLKDALASSFYAWLNRLSPVQMEPNAADFRLLSKRVVNVFQRDLRERDRFLRGLVAWVGFRSARIEFDAPPRFAGETKYSLIRMLAFARVGIVSFSKVPLRVAAFVGFIVSLLSLLYGFYVVVAYFLLDVTIMPGWASIVLVSIFLGGCQLLFLGLLGEYIGTVFDETKARPLYVAAEIRPCIAPK